MDGKFYTDVYEIIGGLTPLKSDCGLLCGRRCCEGGDGDGMHLYPGEESLYPGADWYSIVDTNIPFGEGKLKLFVCKGRCPREQRPLACRLFPLMPALSPQGRLAVRMQPYRDICPLCSSGAGIKGLDADFVSAVKKAVRLLGKDAGTMAFVRLMTEIYGFHAL